MTKWKRKNTQKMACMLRNQGLKRARRWLTTPCYYKYARMGEFPDGISLKLSGKSTRIMEKRQRPYSEVVIIGAGLSGINMACQLQRQLNATNYTIYDRAAELGGAWAANKCRPSHSCTTLSLRFLGSSNSLCDLFHSWFPARRLIVDTRPRLWG